MSDDADRFTWTLQTYALERRTRDDGSTRYAYRVATTEILSHEHFGWVEATKPSK